MNPFMLPNVPHYIKRELEELQKQVMPLLKKSAGFSFIAIPMVGFSIVNILFFVFVPDSLPYTTPLLILFAIIGAVGMALFKESRIHNKEVQVQGIEYMKGRIKGSTIISEDNKERYVKSIHNNPEEALHTFCQFLNQEERTRRFSQI